jgi:hypothetical protein
MSNSTTPPDTPPRSGNGLDDILRHVAPEITSPPSRARIEELEAAVTTTSGGVSIGQIETRYECRGKIKRGEFFRTHPNRALWLESAVLVDEDGIDKTTYLVSPTVQPLLQRWLSRVLLIPCINQDRCLFVWSIPIADITIGQRSTRSEAVRRVAAQQALTTWSTVVWFQSEHHVVPADAPEELGEPRWPDDLDKATLLLRTFQDHLIADAAHPILRVYLGRARR